MKTIKYFFFIALGSLLMAADCSNKDSEFYNDIYLSVPNLITIETQDSYVVNDVLYINSDNFSQLLDEPGKPNQLDILKTTGGAQSFNFTYMLEKKAADNSWQLVSLGPNLSVLKGFGEENELFVSALCIYNPLTKHYEMRHAITLSAPGDYRLSFGYNSANTTGVDLRSDSVGNNLFANINSATAHLDAGGFYNFSVTE